MLGKIGRRKRKKRESRQGKNLPKRKYKSQLKVGGERGKRENDDRENVVQKENKNVRKRENADREKVGSK